MPTRQQWEDELSQSLITCAQYDALSEEVKAEGFEGELAFGTAGIRGKIGLGPNRLNRFTVQKVAYGLSQYLNETADSSSVVIAYDTRHFSPEFSDEIATVLASNGIKTYIYDRYHTTPELSYSVRHLKTDAGVMITASHNPPEYNGIKIYGPDGGQLALEGSKKVSQYIDQINDELKIDVKDMDDLKSENLIVPVPDEVVSSYKKEVTDLIQEIPSSDLKVVFSSLHGTSVPIVPDILEAVGFTNFQLVDAQCKPDADFSSVKSANPEDHDAFDMAVELGQEVQADLLIATDPDADRMGVVALHEGEYHYFNGNQLGSLLLNYRIQQTEDIQNRAAVKSIVTSELGKVIAEKNNVKMFDVLTGFKFIAEKIAEFEASHDYHYIFGYEESYGYMASPFVRDKDAVQIVPLIIKLASQLKNEGKTLVDQMNEIYENYGHYQEKLFAHTFEGQSGKDKIQSIMQEARTNAPSEIAGLKVIATEDYLKQERVDDEGRHRIDLPQADVLKFFFEDGWIALRPSGTEPKIKLYVSLITDDIEAISQKINTIFFS
ncbi:phospho-sugar mutase [Macrococcus hajekii]|uniref:Phosphoglucomutase n=1 Tax=Macrococcus hajekii TaxID=198482 RepID=A0A4R6BN44_9STAP|nr:phospho-sugar mutase [Macrococcus hajekii]TDM03256.1 phospho-sugar mutase [Macrococcus hajekii]GGA97355.1 phosphoglucomutase [Macrococcus hajekii]